LGSFHQRSRVMHFLWSCGYVGSSSSFPDHAEQTNVAGEWA
jgi:hypothetical protein